MRLCRVTSRGVSAVRYLLPFTYFCGPFPPLMYRLGTFPSIPAVFVRTQQLGFEGKACKSCFGLSIKISFRQDIDRVVEVLGSAKVCVCVCAVELLFK